MRQTGYVCVLSFCLCEDCFEYEALKDDIFGRWRHFSLSRSLKKMFKGYDCRQLSSFTPVLYWSTIVRYLHFMWVFSATFYFISPPNFEADSVFFTPLHLFDNFKWQVTLQIARCGTFFDLFVLTAIRWKIHLFW